MLPAHTSDRRSDESVVVAVDGLEYAVRAGDSRYLDRLPGPCDMVQTNIQLGPADAGMRISAREFASAEYAEPFIYERVQGRLVVMSPAGPEHRTVSKPYRRELGLY